jgi:hypothetical protein
VWSVGWDGMTGQPTGAPRWPFPGGLVRQPNRLVEACKLLRNEWAHVEREKPQKRPDAVPEGQRPDS